MSALLQIPMMALLDLWEELVLAREGKNGFGGTVAEIYAYRFHAREPSLEAAVAGEDVGAAGVEALQDRQLETRNALMELLVLFAEKYQVLVSVGDEVCVVKGRIIADAPLTDHRWHVSVHR